MNNRGNSNLGDEIKNIVQNALNNKDFNKLNKDIGNFVASALDEVKNSIQGDKNKEKKKSINRKKLMVPKGRVSSYLFTILGAVGTSIFGIAIFILIVLGFLPSSRAIFNTIAIILLPFLILSIVFLVKGNSESKRLKRFQKYILQLKGQNYVLIEDLARATKLNKKAVEKDLKIMIEKAMFPQGHIDDEKIYFMLDNEIYDQYLELKKNIAMKDLEKSKKNKYEMKNEKNHLEAEIRKSIDEGRKFISQIKEANAAIPGEGISMKLDSLEEITGKIFDYVEIHPEKSNEIKKFTEYFLPTTLKLVDAYKKLESQSIEGENISNAKKEIEETMDTINLAFENLLDDLFQDLAMDISTDISVLEIIFAQEGLTENNMKIKSKNEEDEK